MSKRARGGSFRFSAAGSLFLKDAVSWHHAKSSTHDTNVANRVEDVSVSIFPSVAHTLFPRNAAGSHNVAGTLDNFGLSDAVKPLRLLNPAWRV